MNGYADDFWQLSSRRSISQMSRWWGPLHGRRRSCTLHRTARYKEGVPAAVLIGAVPPVMVKSAANPTGFRSKYLMELRACR